MRIRKPRTGFTLVELIVVVTIVSLLAAIGIPSYTTYLMESRRNDGINALRSNQLIVENYIHQNGSTPTSSQVTLATTSTNGFYTLSYTQNSSNQYTLTATAATGTSQANDTGCTVLTLTNIVDDIFPKTCH